MEANQINIDWGLYITRDDLARQLKVCPASISNMVKDNRLPEPIRYGRRKYFYMPSVRKYMGKDIKKAEANGN
jgi:predicted transcriptional regulator